MAVPFGPGGGGAGPETQGIVSKLDGDKILINKDSRTINTNGTTKFGDANGDLTKADIKVGDRIMAIGKVETDKSLTARWVLKLAALPNVEGGKVTTVTAASNQFKFTRAKGNEEWTATVNAQTEITKDGAKVTLDKLAKDDNVIISGKADSTAKTIEATRVTVGNVKRIDVRGNALSGTVKSVATDSLVVTQKDKDGKETDVTVKVDANTKYVGGLTKLADLKAADPVFVIGAKQTDGSVKANSISKMPVGPGGRGPGFPGGPGGRGNGTNAPKPSPTPNQ